MEGKILLHIQSDCTILSSDYKQWTLTQYGVYCEADNSSLNNCDYSLLTRDDLGWENLKEKHLIEIEKTKC